MERPLFSLNIVKMMYIDVKTVKPPSLAPPPPPELSLSLGAGLTSGALSFQQQARDRRQSRATLRRLKVTRLTI